MIILDSMDKDTTMKRFENMKKLWWSIVIVLMTTL